MDLLKEIQEKAKNKSGIIILPEANIDERVMEAAKIILKNNFSKIVVFGENKEFPREMADNENCQIIDVNKAENLSQLAEQLY